MPSAATTIRDIAIKAGFSTATVSLALSNSPRIPDSTKDIIRRIAQDLDYRPNTLTRALALSRWHPNRATDASTISESIALIAESEPSRLGTFEDSELAAVKLDAAKLGYRFCPFVLKKEKSCSQIVAKMHSVGIRGVILMQQSEAIDLPDFPWQQFCVVGCNQTYAQYPIDIVRPNYFEATILCWEKLRALGHTRIALIMIDYGRGLTTLDTRCTAAFREMQARDVLASRVLPPLILPIGKQIPRSWLSEHKPTAIIGSNGTILNAIPKNISIPNQLSFVAINRRPNVSTSGVLRPFAHMLSTCLRVLDRKLTHNEFGPSAQPITIVVPPIWKQGETVAAPSEVVF